MRLLHLNNCLQHFFKMFVLLLPMHIFGQSKPVEKIQWSYDYIEKVSAIPVVQDVMLDSVFGKLDLLRSLQKNFSIKESDTGFLKNLKITSDKLQKLKEAGLSPATLFKNLPAFYSIKEYATRAGTDPFSLGINTLELHGLYDNSVFQDKAIAQGTFDFSTKIAGLPVNYTFNWQHPSIGELYRPVYKASFDQKALLSDLKNKVASQFDVEKLLLKDVDFKKLFRGYAEDKLNQYKTLFEEKTKLISTLAENVIHLTYDEFLYLTKEQLTHKLFNAHKTDSLHAVQNFLESALVMATDSSNKAALQQQVQDIKTQLETISELTETLGRIKSEFETKSLNYNQLVQQQQAINKNVSEVVASETFVQKSSGRLLHLNGLTRFFMYVKDLNIGQFSSNWSRSSITDVLTSGIGGSYLRDNKFLGLNVSKLKNMGWLKDQLYTGSLFEAPASIQALRLGKGDPASDKHSHIALLNALVNSGSNALQPILPRNIFVGSFSQKIAIGSLGSIDAELSKSATQYNHTRAGENIYESKAALTKFGEDFFQTLSVGLNYTGEFKSINLTPSVFVSYAGLGYSNPATSSATRGSLSYGFHFIKSAFSKKLLVQSRFSQRSTKTSVDEDHKLNQLQNLLSAQYKLSKKLKLGLSWNYSGLTKKEKGSGRQLFSSNRISTDAYYSGKLGGHFFMQNMNAGFQKINMPGGDIASVGNTIWLHSSSNLMFQQSSVTINMQLYKYLQDKENQGNLFTTEAGWNYVVFKSIHLNSSVNYLDQKNIAKQIGIRQSLSASIHKKISLNIYGDVRKDLITNRNAYLFPKTRGEIELSYTLN